MNFDLEQLDTLLAVVEAGSFEDASIDLGITPSAVSQRIKALEAKAGAILLVRSRPVEPTEQGTRMLGYARQIALLGRELGASMRLTGQLAGKHCLTVGVNADSLATWFAPVFRALAERGDIACEILRSDEHRNAELLKNGRVNGVVTTSAEAVQGCTVHRLGAMRYWAVASEAFLARQGGEELSATWLEEAPVVVFDRDDPLQLQLRRRVTGLSNWSGVMVHYIPDSWQYASAIAAGMGWGMLPELQLRFLPALRVLDPSWLIEVPLFWQRWSLESLALDAMGEILAEAAAEASL